MSTDKDKLKDIASQELELPRVNRKLTEVEKFIRDNNLKPGNKRVEAMRIYLLYWKWKERNYLSQPKFFYEFKNHFEKGMTNSFRYYMLDPAPFDFSEQGWWEFRKQLRLYRQINEQKRKEKKEGKKKRG